jgi:hypothetical protein
MRSKIERPGVIATVLLALPVSAHHSGAMYQESEIGLEGVVTKIDWVNPHIYISIETDEGEIWMIEGTPPAVMRKNGWTPESVVTGDAVLVTARPHKDPDRRLAAGRTVLKEDGTQLVFGPNNPGSVASQPPPAITAEGFSGNWLPPLGFSLYGQLAGDGRPTTGLTEKGIAALESYDPLDVSAENYQCGGGLPAPYTSLLPLLMSIEIGEEETLIRVEGQATNRTVHMNVDSHDGAERALHGHSIGWWDGDVLVVDTTHFTPSEVGHGRGLPSGPLKHVVERFELNEAKTRLIYTFWVADPEYRSEPVTATRELSYRPDLVWSDEPCDSEVARRPL